MLIDLQALMWCLVDVWLSNVMPSTL